MLFHKKLLAVTLIVMFGAMPVFAGACYDQFVDDSYTCASLGTWYERAGCELGAEAMFAACLAAAVVEGAE